jgi:hypothetical protein
MFTGVAAVVVQPCNQHQSRQISAHLNGCDAWPRRAGVCSFAVHIRPSSVLAVCPILRIVVIIDLERDACTRLYARPRAVTKQSLSFQYVLEMSVQLERRMCVIIGCSLGLKYVDM